MESDLYVRSLPHGKKSSQIQRSKSRSNSRRPNAIAAHLLIPKDYILYTVLEQKKLVDAHQKRLEQIQRLRGSVYVAEGAIKTEDLIDGRHVSHLDETGEHVTREDKAGNIIACVRLNFGEDHKTALLGSLCIHPDHRIGRAFPVLIAEAIATAKRLGAVQAISYSTTTNNVPKLLKKIGGKPIGPACFDPCYHGMMQYFLFDDSVFAGQEKK